MLQLPPRARRRQPLPPLASRHRSVGPRHGSCVTVSALALVARCVRDVGGADGEARHRGARVVVLQSPPVARRRLSVDPSTFASERCGLTSQSLHLSSQYIEDHSGGDDSPGATAHDPFLFVLLILMFVLVAIMSIIWSIWCPFTVWTNVGFCLLWLGVPIAYLVYTNIRSESRSTARPSPLWLVLGPGIVWFCGASKGNVCHWRLLQGCPRVPWDCLKAALRLP